MSKGKFLTKNKWKDFRKVKKPNWFRHLKFPRHWRSLKEFQHLSMGRPKQKVINYFTLD